MSMGRQPAGNGEPNGGPRLIRRKSRTDLLAESEDDPLPAKADEGPQVRLRDVLGGWFGGHEHDG